MKEPTRPDAIDPSEASLEDLKREAAETRQKVQEDIGAVVDKVSPAQLKRDAKAALASKGRRARGRMVGAARQLAASAQAHPLAACAVVLLIGGATYAAGKAAARAPRGAGFTRLLAAFSAALVSWRLITRVLRSPPLIRRPPTTRSMRTGATQ